MYLNFNNTNAATVVPKSVAAEEAAADESSSAQSLARVEAAVAQLRRVFDDEHGRLTADVARLAARHDDLSREVALMARLRMEWGALAKLNVGGRTFTTSMTTIRRHPESLLARMFSGRYGILGSASQSESSSEEQKQVEQSSGGDDAKAGEGEQLLPNDDEGRVFIDRNGDLFDHVLDYLREGPERWSIPADEALAHRLAQEFEFYQLPQPPTRCFVVSAKVPTQSREAAFIFVMGGRNDQLGQTLAVIERYDIVANVWTTVGSLPTARNSLAAVLSPEQRVLVLGGLSKENSSVGSFDPFQFTDAVDAEQQKQLVTGWRDYEGLSTVRNAPGGAVVNEYVYALGGHNNAIYLSSVERFDPSKEGGLWERVTEMSTPRYALASVVLDGRICAIGGHSGDAPLASIEVYDPDTDTWQSNLIPDMPTARYYLAAAVIDKRIYVVGGYGADSCSSAVECFDPSTAKWTTLAPLPVPKYALSAVAIGGKLYVLGGFDDRTTFASVDCYDPATNTWSSVADMPTAKYAMGAVAC